MCEMRWFPGKYSHIYWISRWFVENWILCSLFTALAKRENLVMPFEIIAKLLFNWGAVGCFIYFLWWLLAALALFIFTYIHGGTGLDWLNGNIHGVNLWLLRRGSFNNLPVPWWLHINFGASFDWKLTNEIHQRWLRSGNLIVFALNGKDVDLFNCPLARFVATIKNWIFNYEFWWMYFAGFKLVTLLNFFVKLQISAKVWFRVSIWKKNRDSSF